MPEAGARARSDREALPAVPRPSPHVAHACGRAGNAEVSAPGSARTLADMAALSLPPISIDWDVIETATERHPFDRLGWELIARAGQIGERVVDSTGLDDDGNRRSLTLDEAVIGGLFVRMTKLIRGLFDASQSDESEVHQIVARCVVETAANLRWLLLRNDPEEYKRFRADSFVTWRKWLETTTATGDAKLDGIAVRMKQHIETELTA